MEASMEYHNKHMTGDIEFCARLDISDLEYQQNPGLFEERAKRHLTQMLAQKIIHEKMRIANQPENRLHRASIDLYVASPEVFWKTVHEEAMRIVAMYPIMKPSSEHRK
jgi:hypothetical protein